MTSEQPVASLLHRAWRATSLLAALLCSPLFSDAQTTAALRGRIFDESGARVPGGMVSVRDTLTGFRASVRADSEGRFQIEGMPAGAYTVTAESPGLRTEVIEHLQVDAGRVLVRDFRLAVGSRSESVVVLAEIPLLDRASATVAHVVTAGAVQAIPLNGGHFTDLALLTPQAVAPSQAGFSARPIRGVGTLAFNVGGNREETVGFALNGVATNNLTFGSLIFEPPLSSIQEVRIDRSAVTAEHGHVSGALVNIVTRSGSDLLHGDAFEFLRDDALDARNFFELTSPDPHRFERHQFGGSLGGPIVRGRTFFFAAYEGLRQRQGVDLNSVVLSDAQRNAVSDPVVARLLELIPRSNFLASDGTPRFVGSAAAVIDMDRGTLDLRHNAGDQDRLHAFYGVQHPRTIEPLAQGNSIPGFGLVSRPPRSVLTLGEMHVFGPAMLNEVRFGRVRLEGGSFPATTLNPADFGIRNGVTRPIGLPQIVVAGGLNFGGPGTLPTGRYDTSYVLADTHTRVSGSHTLKLGGEYRHFVNENFAEGTGIFNFPSVEAFLAGTANAFTITLGERQSLIDQRAASLFVQDTVMLPRGVTLELGMRYEWHVTPTERHDRFVVFDARQASLVRVGVDLDRIYQQNNRNIEPRIGVAWIPSPDGRTVVRGAYARTVDQPGTTAVRDTAGNPPFATPLTASGTIRLGSAIDSTRPVGLAPVTVDSAFRNASLQSWNVNVQRQLGPGLATTVGYSGSRGANLRLSRNINQPVDGVRPYPTLSSSSTILPGAALGNVTQVESSGFSSYHAAWVAVTRRLSRGLQFDASYTWSKSLDTNSLNSSGFAIQNAYDLRAEYAPSDFDARHRFVFSGSYALPFDGNMLTRGWQVAAVVQSQSGNPVNIVTSSSTVNGIANTLRPDVVGPIRIIGSVDRWLDPSVFVAVDRFGNLGRNAVTGPSYHNTDLSIVKEIRGGTGTTLLLRMDVFDVFNHPNFGPPGNIVGSPNFGRITRTRLPTGEAGSSRQIQLAARLAF
jgi:hypothetical protein